MYLDQAARREDREFERLVVAVNLGTATFHDRKAHRAWQRRRRVGSQPSGGGLEGAALERAVMGLRSRNPEYVVVGE